MRFYIVSILLVSLQVTTGLITLTFPPGYKSLDNDNNIVTYESPYGNLNMLETMEVQLQFHIEQRHHIYTKGHFIYCDCIYSSSGSMVHAHPVPITESDVANKTLINVTQLFHAGNNSIIFYTDEGRILDEAKFQLRIEYFIAPPESFCKPAMRHFGMPICDQFNIGKGSSHLLSIKALSTKPWNITVGNFCSIGSAQLFLGRTVSHRLGFITTFPLHNLVDADSKYRDEVVQGSSHSVNIGNDVWIGNNAVLINNLTIGHGAVVGANAVVRKSIPPYAIVYGDPAVVVRYRFPAEVVEKLLRMQWWDWEDSRVLAMARYATTDQVIDAWEDGLL